MHKKILPEISYFCNQSPLSFVLWMKGFSNADGRVWVYYYDQKADVTDLFDEEGICKVSLTHEGQTIYLEIERGEDGAYPYSQTNDLPEDSEHYTPVATQKVGEDESVFHPDTKADSLPEAERAKSAES